MDNNRWCEISGKDWDKLSQGSREIFLTPAIEHLKEGENDEYGKEIKGFE